MVTPYSTKGLPPLPTVSKTTIPMTGLLVDVYGLDELPASTPVTCLWLLHPRTRSRNHMHEIASRTLEAWYASEGSSRRGLVALAFDMPNHGSRLVSDLANLAWDEGNNNHALDMLGMVKGGVSDMKGLMDLVAGYLGREVDSHACLGVSLGGHGAWQAWMGEERIDTAVSIIGCPDLIDLMNSRAKETKVDAGASFLGSKYFPPDLLATCFAHDPKAILFGTKPVPSSPLSSSEQSRFHGILAARVRGKRLLLCSGSVDELVPYAKTKPLANFLQQATGENGWCRDLDVVVDNRVYDGVGHRFSADMIQDAVKFLVESVGKGPRKRVGDKVENKSVL